MADGLYIPDFDQEEDLEPDDMEKEEGPNRTFLIGAIILGGVFVFGICAVVAYLVFIRGRAPAETADIPATNEYLQGLANETATAEALTQAAPVEEEPAAEEVEPVEEEPVITLTATPTTSLVVTAIEGTPTPEGGIIEEEEETPEGTGEPPAEEEATAKPGEEEPAEVTPTSHIVAEATPLGGEATPTREVSGIGEEEGESIVEGELEEVGVTATGVGGPVEPTLPTTGIATNTSIAGVALLAVALVAVVAIARRLRLQ